MFCENCGKGISDDSRFCEYCGDPVEVQKNTSRASTYEDEVSTRTVPPIYAPEPEVKSVSSEYTQDQFSKAAGTGRGGAADTSRKRAVPISVIAIIAVVAVVVISSAGFFPLRGNSIPKGDGKGAGSGRSGDQVWALTSIILDKAEEEITAAGKTDTFSYARKYTDGIVTYAFEDQEQQASGVYTLTVPKPILELEETQEITLSCITHEGRDRSLGYVSAFSKEVYYENLGWDSDRVLRGDSGITTVNIGMKPVFKETTEKGFILSLTYFAPETESASEWSTFIGCSLVYTLMDAKEAEKKAVSVEEVFSNFSYNTELIETLSKVSNAVSTETERETEADTFEQAENDFMDIFEEIPIEDTIDAGFDNSNLTETYDVTGIEGIEDIDTAGPEYTSRLFSTEERPTWDDFSWYEEVLSRGFWDGARPIIKTEDLLGSWKGYMMFENGVEYLVNAKLEVEGDEGIVTIDWYLAYIDGEVYDCSDDRDSAFVGDYANQTFYVTGPGNISLDFFYEHQNTQYAWGRMLMQSGEEADFCLMRP